MPPSPPHSSSPVPWGPYNPLWPGRATKAAPHPDRSTGSTPADWDASTIRGVSVSRQVSAMSATGRIMPNTLETWVHTTARGRSCRMARRNSSAARSGRKSGVSITVTDSPGMACRGRVTALCSYPEITTRSPDPSSDRMAMFSPWVALVVMMTFSGCGTPSSSAASWRHR